MHSHIYPECGNCNVYRNVGRFLTFYAAYIRKKKFYTESKDSKICRDLRLSRSDDSDYILLGHGLVWANWSNPTFRRSAVFSTSGLK